MILLLAGGLEGFAQHYVTVRPVKQGTVTRSPAPGPDYVWISEEWKWVHTEYVWAGGYWAAPPYKNGSWVHGYWKRGHEGWTWVPGHWARTGKEPTSCNHDILFPDITNTYARFEYRFSPGPKDIRLYAADYLLVPGVQRATGLE